MRDRNATAAIRALAERQHGVVAHRQLIDLGIGAGLQQARLDGGVLLPLHRGVFAVGHEPRTKEARWMAAVLASGPGSVLSHASALALWGLGSGGGSAEVLRRSGGPRSRRSGIRLHQTRSLPDDHVTVEARIPVATIERTLADMAGRLDASRLERLVVAADRSGRLRWPELYRQLRHGRGRKGIGRLRAVALDVDPRAVDAFSPAEVDFLALCREESLPLPSVNKLAANLIVDFLWPGERVVVELDSYTYHRDRPAFERDHARTIRLVEAGYVVHRVTPRMLKTDPTRFVNLLRRALLERTASTSGAGSPTS